MKTAVNPKLAAVKFCHVTYIHTYIQGKNDDCKLTDINENLLSAVLSLNPSSVDI
jgi:hypothetical protein